MERSTASSSALQSEVGMNNSGIIWVLLIILVGVVFYVTGNGFYRYPCQDPENMTSELCNPPMCLATHECTSDLIGTPNG